MALQAHAGKAVSHESHSHPDLLYCVPGAGLHAWRAACSSAGIWVDGNLPAGPQLAITHATEKWHKGAVCLKASVDAEAEYWVGVFPYYASFLCKQTLQGYRLLKT